MEMKMNKTAFPTVFVLLGILGVIGVMAGTSIFDPVIKFIHTDNLSVQGALLCMVFTIAGFLVCFQLLNVLCTYFVPRIESSDSSGKHA
jgi:energy-converting hydrogenase Eha subunit E